MLTIRTAAHIRGPNSLRGFRSCAASTGVVVAQIATRRILRAEASRSTREVRRRWLAEYWNAHRTRVCLRYTRSGLSAQGGMN